MSPKEKALELVDKFLNLKIDLTGECWTRMKIDTAKESALIAVDEILRLENNSHSFDGANITGVSYWQEVKQEIQKL